MESSPATHGRQIPSGSAWLASLVHTSQAAIIVNLGLVFAALLCSFGLPSSLSSDQAEENV